MLNRTPVKEANRLLVTLSLVLSGAKEQRRSGSMGAEMLPPRFAQGFGSRAQHDSQDTGQVRSPGSLISKCLFSTCYT